MIADKNVEIELKKWDDYYLKSDLSFHYKKNRPLIVDLLDVKYHLKLNGTITVDELNILELGLRHSWYEIYNQLAGKIVSQFYTNQIIRNLCSKLIEDKHAKIRSNLFYVLLFNLSISKSKEFLIKALEDKSIKVVEVGIQFIELNDLQKYLPVLQQLITKFPKYSKSIENSIQYITKGYILEEESENSMLLIVKYKNTYHSQCFDKKLLTKSFINQVINKYKNDNY